MSKSIFFAFLALFILTSAAAFIISKKIESSRALAAGAEADNAEENTTVVTVTNYLPQNSREDCPLPLGLETQVSKKISEKTGTARFEVECRFFGEDSLGDLIQLSYSAEASSEWERPESLVIFKVSGKDTVHAKSDSFLFSDEDIVEGKKYRYFAVAYFPDSELISEATEEISYFKPWFSGSNTSMLAGSLIFTALLIFFIKSAGSGKKFFIRKLSGIDAVDEAIGRATEMGKDVLFIPGIMDMDDVQTIAGMIILGRVARKVANYESKLSVPSIAPVAYNTAKEIVRQAYIQEGRPDSYDENSVFYLTGDQFGYAAAVDGIMVREKPATVFLMGHFYAESLILAETGHSIGAIQISGTADPSQLPFFVAACDYTLIGEEFFAASAYMSDDPRLVGSLKAQDLGKAVAIAALVAGSILVSLGVNFVKNLFFTG
ncbi:hypothetical protein JW890_08585 [candidate division WOR-3 bacterium]|nr:hypothetical protein [candidate division WOR-3 bacterium]